MRGKQNIGLSSLVRVALAVFPLVAVAVTAVAQTAPEPPGGTIAARMKEAEETTKPYGGQIEVTAVTTTLIAFDKQGRAVIDLRPEELMVLEDGKVAKIIGLESSLREVTPNDKGSASGGSRVGSTLPAVSTHPWRVVVYVSTELAGRFVLPTLCRQTAAEAERLTDLGPVEIVVADPTPTLLLGAENRSTIVQSTLERVATEETGLTTVERIRAAFTKEFRPGVGFDRQYTITQSSPQTFATRARAAALRERTVIRGELDRMVAWIESQPPEARGLLLWMTGGFDLNTADFYIPFVEQIDPSLATILRSDYRYLSLEPEVRQMVEVALSYGWTIIPVGLSRSNFVFGADVGGTGKVQHAQGVGANSIDAQESEFRQVAPNYPLQIIARATGGELVINDVQLENALDHISGAYLVTYQVDRPVDGRLHHVEIRCSRPGLKLRGRQYSASGTLRGVATARARHLLEGDDVNGNLRISAAIHNIIRGRKGQSSGELDIDADLVDLRQVLSPAGLGRMRVTVVVEIENGPPFIHHQELDIDWNVTGSVWTFGTDIIWPKKARRMAVVVEELVSSSWGAEVIELW